MEFGDNFFDKVLEKTFFKKLRLIVNIQNFFQVLC